MPGDCSPGQTLDPSGSAPASMRSINGLFGAVGAGGRSGGDSCAARTPVTM